MKIVLSAAACGVLSLSGVLSACSSDESEASVTDGPAVVAMPVSNAALLVGGPVEEPGEERLAGKPVVVNGCLGAQSGTKNFLVVWPDGTTVDTPEADTLEIGDQLLEPGAAFVGRGSFVTREPFPEEFPSIPLKCLGPNQEKIMWLHEIDEVTE